VVASCGSVGGVGVRVELAGEQARASCGAVGGVGFVGRAFVDVGFVGPGTALARNAVGVGFAVPVVVVVGIVGSGSLVNVDIVGSGSLVDVDCVSSGSLVGVGCIGPVVVVNIVGSGSLVSVDCVGSGSLVGVGCVGPGTALACTAVVVGYSLPALSAKSSAISASSKRFRRLLAPEMSACTAVVGHGASRPGGGVTCDVTASDVGSYFTVPNGVAAKVPGGT
jgi:hypothetical protein